MYRSWSVKFRITVITALIIGAAHLPVAYSAEDTAPIEEIVVTAQKREQSLLDVGIAISVLSGEELSQLRVEEVGDLALHVSNMNVKNTLGATNPVVTIRGVGLNDFNANNNPTAGVYIDEVFLTSTAMMGFQLFDMERVEVLKGPQGTLYGRNTTILCLRSARSKNLNGATISREHLICSDESQRLTECLREQQAIERVRMMHRESGDLGRVARRHRQLHESARLDRRRQLVDITGDLSEP
jgi:hypothetical protein